MRVIKKGRNPDEVPWRGTCTKCQSVVEAKRNELTSVEYDQRENGQFGRANCPECDYGMIFYPTKE